MPKEVYVTYPEDMTEMGKDSLFRACKQAGIQIPLLVPEDTATVSYYAHYHLQDFKQNMPRVIVFIDIGNAKTTATVAQYKYNERG